MLFLLGILAAAVGVQAARRLDAAERIRGRFQAYAAARAGVATAVAVLALGTNGWDALSERWADSPGDFQDIPCGNGRFSVVRAPETQVDGGVTNFGAADESARIDLNYASADMIRGLLAVAGGLATGAADELSRTIVRQPADRGGSRPAGTNSFQCVQDLLGVAGMDEALFRRVEPYITVCSGSRRVNINTVGPVVLESLLRGVGTTPAGGGDAVPTLVRKILQFRQGGGMFTPQAGLGLSGVLARSIKLEGNETALLNALLPVVSVASGRFRIVSEGECLMGRRFQRRIECVWNRAARRFEFWNED